MDSFDILLLFMRACVVISVLVATSNCYKWLCTSAKKNNNLLSVSVAVRLGGKMCHSSGFVTSLLLLAWLTVFSACASENCKNSRSQENLKSGELQILTLSPDKVAAVYKQQDCSVGIDSGETESKKGLHIFSSTDHQGSHLVNITSLDGKEVVFVRHSLSSSASLLRIKGHSIFIQDVPTGVVGDDGRTGKKKVDFALPLELSHHFDRALSEGRLPEEHILQHLDRESVHETKRAGISELSGSPELSLAEEVCHAMGDAGIMGYEHPAALQLYKTVLHFSSLPSSDIDGRPAQRHSHNITDSKRRRQISLDRVCPNQEKMYRRSLSERVFSSRNPFACDENCPIGDKCIGMCGPGCTLCWWFVCGDCCFHQGCYEHDMCCRKVGYFQPGCLNIFNFSCDSFVCEED